MITRFQRITIVKLKPVEENLNKELQFLSESLGLFSERDKERSCFRIFIELLKATKKKEGLSSDELAYKLNLSRGTVVYHLTRLIGAGLVVVNDNKYSLRDKNLESTLKKMKQDFVSAYEEIENAGREIDKKLGL
ncbi:helix-turn-helix transcriptional regulator [archaeon]|jgi:predicted transcriptional regulator|nr:helix-turn-helix transcriptional regulator [archaeon]MBT4441389.1 helix-turn-helix transcriptional regulator [archaeon]